MKKVLYRTRLRRALPDTQSVSSLIKPLTEPCAVSHQAASRGQQGATAHTTPTTAHTGDSTARGPRRKSGGESEELRGSQQWGVG